VRDRFPWGGNWGFLLVLTLLVKGNDLPKRVWPYVKSQRP
jgi:hypothetical protein